MHWSEADCAERGVLRGESYGGGMCTPCRDFVPSSVETGSCSSCTGRRAARAALNWCAAGFSAAAVAAADLLFLLAGIAGGSFAAACIGRCFCERIPSTRAETYRDHQSLTHLLHPLLPAQLLRSFKL